MWNRMLAAVLAVGITTLPLLSFANETSGVAKFMPTARMSLEQGLRAAETEGQPISGKFEVDEGHLQLSVYTAKDGKFAEVLVDQSTGKVEKSEAITAGNELAVAERQMEAYGKSKTSLRSAVSRAELANPGFQAVSVTPTLSKGRAVAVVSLLHGIDKMSITEPLE